MSQPHEEKNIAEIIPAVKLPRDLTQFFSYKIPEDLKEEIAIGDAVKIPFRKEEIMGIVKSFSQEVPEGFKIKEMKGIVKELSFSKEQMELAKFISKYYFTPLSLVIDIMLPFIPKKESRKEISLNNSYDIEKPEKALQEKISQSIEIEKGNNFLLIHNLEASRHELYKSTMEKQNETGQTLLMLPEYFDIWNIAQFYVDAFGKEKVAILCSDITKNQYFKEWQKVKSGEAKLVISTRQGVFAPFQNLKLIIVDEEHNSSYKQWDQNPRYHGVDAAIKLAEIHQAKIILSSPAPSLEAYHRTQNDFAKIDISEKPKVFPQIVDFDVERKNGNYSFIGEKLKEELLEKIYAKKQALIFIPRLGEKTIHQCKDCGYIAECEVCQSPLIGYKSKLYCSRCKQIYEIIKSCPKCHGQNISAFGGGSQRVFGEIEALFENKNIKIVELDSSTSEDGKRNQKVFEDFQRGRIDILVGTQMVWKNWNMKNLDPICIIFPEIIFGSPGFKSKERSWQFLNKTYTWAQDRTVVIETYKPEHKYFTEIKNKTTEEFLREELETRHQNLSPIPYPPFGKLIKLIYKNQDALVCEKEAKWQYEILQKEIFDNNLQSTFEVLPPFPAQSYREHRKYRWHIIIKHKNGIDLSARDALLHTIKSAWIIDVDPDEIL
jgi:primosomal protein N' (replication factor Y)